MADINELTNINRFFFYGRGDVNTEIQHDLVIGLLQPDRSAYYFRDYGVGAEAYENAPNNLELQVELKFRIADFVARRNQRVTNGSGAEPDRRVATSQSVIRVESLNRGEIDVTMLYVPYAFIDSPQTISTQRGAS